MTAGCGRTSDAVVPGAEEPDPKGPTSASASGVSPLPVRALHREAERARGWLESGVWRPDAADAEAAARVLARLTAPLPRRGAAWARARAVDRDRRLQRIWRSAVHHLDAGAVSPPAAALLAAVARAYVPWYGTPNPPPAAAAPRYPVPSGSAAPEGTAAHGAATRDAADRPETPPTDAGEALLPGLIDVFTALAAPAPPGTGARHPAAVPWRTRYAGRFPALREARPPRVDGRHVPLPRMFERGRAVDRRLRLAPGHPGLPVRGDDRPPRPHVLRGLPRPARRVRRPRSAALPGRPRAYAHVRRAGPRPPQGPDAPPVSVQGRAPGRSARSACGTCPARPAVKRTGRTGPPVRPRACPRTSRR